MGPPFRVYLPRDLSGAVAPATTPRAVPSRSTGTETILMVDDEAALRKVAERALAAAIGQFGLNGR